MTASCTRRPPTIRIEIGSRVDRNIVRLFGSEGLQAARCYKKISGGKQKFLTERDQEILSLCKVKVIDEEIKGSEVVTATIICLKGKVDKANKANMSTQQHVESRQATVQPMSQNVVCTRLPKLSLPKFRGDASKWNTFWDSF